jgi:hypothetical protein
LYRSWIAIKPELYWSWGLPSKVGNISCIELSS